MANQFEYKYISTKAILDEKKNFAVSSGEKVRSMMEEELNRLGKDGWQLVAAVPIDHQIFGCGGVAWCDFVFMKDL